MHTDTEQVCTLFWPFDKKCPRIKSNLGPWTQLLKFYDLRSDHKPLNCSNMAATWIQQPVKRLCLCVSSCLLSSQLKNLWVMNRFLINFLGTWHPCYTMSNSSSFLILVSIWCLWNFLHTENAAKNRCRCADVVGRSWSMEPSRVTVKVTGAVTESLSVRSAGSGSTTRAGGEER